MKYNKGIESVFFKGRSRLEQDTEKMFENLVEAMEIYDITYLEMVIRDISDNVLQIELIRDTIFIIMTRPLDSYIDVQLFPTQHGDHQTETIL